MSLHGSGSGFRSGLNHLHREFDRRDTPANPIKFDYLLITDSATEPVDSTEVQEFIKDVDASEISLLNSLTKSARLQIELLTGRVLINQTWKAFSDVLPARVFELRFGRIDSITSITVFSEDGTPTVVSAADYFIAQASAKVGLKHGATWPTLGQILEGFQVEFVAGMGADETFVPQDLKTAIKQLTTHYFEYREPIAFNELPKEIQFAVNDLIKVHRIWNV